MARPRSPQPTPAELEALKIVWERGPCTVRDVMAALGTRRAYTSVMSLLNVMTEKGFLARTPCGRAFSYRARAARGRTLGGMLVDLLRRGFEGSPSALVAHLLDQSKPTGEELAAIDEALEAYRRARGGK